jgi:hypothetical protein
MNTMMVTNTTASAGKEQNNFLVSTRSTIFRLHSITPPQRTNKPASDDPTIEPLGKDFTPGSFDVVCARGKQAWNHPGNKFLRALVDKGKDQYGSAKNKLQRSIVVSEIVNAVRAEGNGFVKVYEQKQWNEIGDVLAREKISQLLRNANSNIYKSSAKAKKRRRKEMCSKVFDNFHHVLRSNQEVTRIMDNINHDVRQPRLTDEEVVILFNKANSELLSSFKQDMSLIVRFNDVMNVANFDDDETA